jgi:hypothetical protein
VANDPLHAGIEKMPAADEGKWFDSIRGFLNFPKVISQETRDAENA